MTARILLFETPERFTVGTVGQPGERTFLSKPEIELVSSPSLSKRDRYKLSLNA